MTIEEELVQEQQRMRKALDQRSAYAGLSYAERQDMTVARLEAELLKGRKQRTVTPVASTMWANLNVEVEHA